MIIIAFLFLLGFLFIWSISLFSLCIVFSAPDVLFITVVKSPFLLGTIVSVFFIILEITPFMFLGILDNKDRTPFCSTESTCLKFSGDLIITTGLLCTPY